MNKIYRVVWNAETGQWVVASEMAKGRKKRSAGSKAAGILLGTATLGIAMVSPAAFAANGGGLDMCSEDGTAHGYGASGDGNLTSCSTATYDWGLFSDVGPTGGNVNAPQQTTLSGNKDGTMTIMAVNGVKVKNTMDMNNQKITSVGDGALAAGSKDAVNGGQLFDVKTTADSRIDGVAANPLKFSGNTGTAVSRKLGDTLAIKGLASTAGTFSGNNINTVADGTGAITIQMADSPKFGEVNLADGAAAADAVNKGQMDKAIADATGGFSSSPLTFAGNDGTVDRKLGDTVTIQGGKTTAGNYSSDNITTEAADDGSITIKMAEAPKFGDITINDEGKITGLANGTATGDAATFDQVKGLADVIGGDTKVDPTTGEITTPTFDMGDGTTTSTVSDAIENLGDRTEANTTVINDIINNGNAITNLTGTHGDRVLSGVAAGSADNEAVNVKQLKDAGVIDPSGKAKSVVTYDSADKTSITMGGEGAAAPVAIHNVADGVGDRDAVNVGQLNQRLADGNAQTLNQANAYTDQKFNDVWQNMGDAINQVNQQANRGIAAASALVNVTPYLPGHTAVNAGVASYRGEAALGVGVSRWSENGRVNLNAGVSAAQGDQPVFRVGVGYVF